MNSSKYLNHFAGVSDAPHQESRLYLLSSLTVGRKSEPIVSAAPQNILSL